MRIAQSIVFVVGSVLVCCATCPAQAETGVELTNTHLVMTVNGNAIAEYRFGDVQYKPYIEIFRTPSGMNLLRDAPHDHLHHHALMFAVGVDGVDFWQEGNLPGTQVQKEFAEVGDLHPRYETAGFVQRLNWVGPESGEPLLAEKRTVHVFDPEEFGTSLLSWETELTVPAEKGTATLTGSHYFGLGMRFIESMDEEGSFFNADQAEGEPVRGDEQLTRSRWCAYAAMANGSPVTVAMFDSPENARHPAWWFTMQTPFAYLSATLNLHREPMELKSGAPLTLRYGVAFWDGHVDAEAVEQAFRKWLETLQPAEEN